MSTLFNTASEIVQDAVDSPLTVLRKLGLNIPSKKDVSTGITTIAETISPAADIKEMIEGSEKTSEGNIIPGMAQIAGGLAGAFIPGSAKVRSAGKAVGKELDEGISKFVKDGEVGEDEFLSSGKLLKNYTTKDQNILNSLMGKATAGSKLKNKKINTFIEEGTPVGGRLNLSSKIKDAPVGLDKLQTVHSKNFRGGVLGYEPVTTVVAPKGGKVKFNVGQTNREKIASGKDTKHPAASVDGLYTSKFNLLDDPEAIEIGFNPKMHHLFIDLKTGQAVKDADAATMIGDRVYAKGVSYFKQTKSPNPISSSTVKYKEKNMGGQVMPMQYGGGLSDAYSTLSDRRQNQNMYGMGNAPMQQMPSQMSSVFQDPMEASAFSPVNMEQGGDIVVPQERMINDQPHQLSYINPQEAGLLKALGGSGSRVDGIPAYFMSDDEMDQADFDAGAFTGDTQGRGDAGENYATIDSQGNQTQAADIAADRANQQQFLAKGREIDDNRLINYATQIGRELDTYEDQKNNLFGDKTLKGFRNSVRNSLVNDLINAGVRDPDKVADQMMARSGSGFGDVASGSMTGEGGLSNFFYERGERFKDQLQSRIEELKKDDEVVDKDKGFFSSLKNMINNPLKDKIGKDPQIRDFLASQGVKDFRSFDQFSPTNLAIKGGLSLIPGVGTASTIGTLLSKLTGSEVVGTFSDPVTGKMMSLDTLGNTTFISPDSLTSGAADESGNDQIKEEVIKDPIDKPVVVEEDEKSAMSQLLAKRINNTSTIDPNVKIIMDVYGISQEEAQEFLGKKGVGTGSASEFEGI